MKWTLRGDGGSFVVGPPDGSRASIEEDVLRGLAGEAFNLTVFRRLLADESEPGAVGRWSADEVVRRVAAAVRLGRISIRRAREGTRAGAGGRPPSEAETASMPMGESETDKLPHPEGADAERPPGTDPVWDAAEVLACSPLAMSQIRTLKQQAPPWRIRYSQPSDNPPPPASPCHPGGSWCSRETSPPEIVIAHSTKDRPHTILSILAHEIGHANFRLPGTVEAYLEAVGQLCPPGPPISRQDFAKRYILERFGRDEGAATLNCIEVANEANANCPPPPGVPVSGSQAATYQAVAARQDLTPEQKQREIAATWAVSETASTTGTTYADLWWSPGPAGMGGADEVAKIVANPIPPSPFA